MEKYPIMLKTKYVKPNEADTTAEEDFLWLFVVSIDKTKP